MLVRASGQVFLGRITFLAVKDNTIKSGTILARATSIPHVTCSLQHGSNSILVKSQAECEMRALTAVTSACLSIYESCSANNNGIIITNIQIDNKVCEEAKAATKIPYVCEI